jgi:two-component system chemotaxis sensor kinase CheA
MVDELLNEFLNESREHLATIETDLLAIEEAGADRDDDLVNKVFRAAHSIKGGSAFFGLTRIKDLAHKAETVLDMLRSGKMVPNAEITNVLLASFDRLREMIDDPVARESSDTSELTDALSGLASSYLSPAEKSSLTRFVSLSNADGSISVTLPEIDAERTRCSGQFVYCVDLDLIHDLERQGKTPLVVFRDIWETGEILDCILDLEAVGSLDGPIGNRLPLRLVFATIIRPDDVGMLIPDCANKVQVVSDPNLPSNFKPVPAPAIPIVHAPDASTSPALEAPAAREITPSFAPSPTPVLPVTPRMTAESSLPHAHAESASKPEAPAPRATPAKKAAGENAHGSENGSSQPAGAETTLRVQVGLLETLMNLAGEMILSRNQLRDAIARKDSRALAVADQRLNLVTSDLQDAIMQTRLQPIGNVFARFPRVVRDLSAMLKKDVHLELRGHDVAMDKSLIEGLADPLTHMVRNAVDHGLETPEVRVAAGKGRQGTVRLEAKHEAGQVVIEVADDGKGIDSRRIAESAINKGLVTAEKVQSLSEQDLLQLIFLPGLSTAEKITEVSGRGVGMDVVKTNLDRIGGKVEILSSIGHGTLFRIKLPLTLAIIPSLIISVGKDRFAIPQVSVEELLHVRAQDIDKRIDLVGGSEVLRLRDRIIPMVCFGDFLRGSVELPMRERQGLDIAVLTTGTLTYGLVVSAFHDTEEIVVKPLGRHLKGLSEYAGATILGDGTVALILDVAGLGAKARLNAVSGADDATESTANTNLVRSLLLFNNAPDELCATPLDTVLRIERIRADQVETFGGRRTMQYRGVALPLVTLGDVAPVKSVSESPDLAVIVSRVHGREVGLLGAMPVDVVEIQSAVDQTTHRQRGIAGSVIIQSRTALIADLVELVDCAYPDWALTAQAAASELQLAAAGEIAPPSPTSASASAPAPAPAGSPSQAHGGTPGNGSGPGERRKPVILLAEDSDFFRAQVKRYLEEDGDRVLDAADGELAWQTLMDHLGEVEAVVTDVEMPRLTGLELAARIRADSRTARLPIIALSSLAGEEDIARGKAAGVSDYQVKLDRDRLVTRLREYLDNPESVVAG